MLFNLFVGGESNPQYSDLYRKTITIERHSFGLDESVMAWN